MLNMDQTQRRDINTTLEDRLTLAIDEENIADNPYIFEPTSFVGNNWFKQGNNIVKLNLAEQDSLIFLSSPLTKLLQKDITNVIVSFDYNISNVSVNYPILSNISLTCMEMTNYMLVENILTTQGHIDVDCSLFNFSSNVVNNSISEQGFKVGINFNGNKSNATIKLSNVQIQFKYQNKLSTQEDSVVNRLEPHIDFYRDEDGDLVLQIGGDASGKGMDHSGGDIDTYTKTEIDNKLATKVNTEIGKGLSSNDYTLTEKTKLGTVETNANYYVHPSSHQTGMITESSALTNLETSENATQHEINLAIDSKINSGGGSVDWSDIENKPSDYPPSTHNHDDRYYTESEIDTALSNKVSKSSTSGLLKNDGTVDTTSYSTFSGSYNDLSNKPSIPSSSSDLSDGSDLVKKSSTSGLLKNDGSVDTNSYLTSSSLSNYVQKSSTTGLLKNDGSVMASGTGSSNWAVGNHTHGNLSNDGKVGSSRDYFVVTGYQGAITSKSKIGDITIDGIYDNIYPSTFAQDTQGVDRILFAKASQNDIIRACEYLPSYVIKDSNAHSYIGSSANANQSVINSAIDTALSGKQATLVSGTNIKTINNTSLLGSGNISIQGGGSVTVDSALSTTSENPVQNKVITGALNGKADSSSLSTVATSGSYTDLSNKPSIPSKVSDLTNDTGFITSSSLPTKTSDLQNDGSNSSDSLVYVETSSTSGLLKSDGSVDTNSYIKDTELIPINSDLNDYNKTGFYACNLSSADLSTLQNCPVSEGFSLLVEENKTFNNTGYKQTLTTWGKNGKPQVYIRTYVYDDMYSNPPQAITSGWQLWYEDTGWQDLSFPSGFGHYSSNQKAQYRRIGKIVHLRGAVKNTNAFTSSNDTSNHIATISDTTCRPSAQNELSIQQGSGQNRFLLTIDTNGKLYCARYGTTSNTQVNASAWLNINCTFMVE